MDFVVDHVFQFHHVHVADVTLFLKASPETPSKRTTLPSSGSPAFFM